MKNKSQINIVVMATIFISFVLFYLGKSLMITKDTMPVWSDEFVNFLNAKAAYFNHTLQASFTLTGHGAKWLGADPHGFVYPSMHYGIAQIFGWNNANIIFTNLGLLLFGLGLIFFSKLNNAQKLTSSILVLSFPFTWFFTLTFMQETIHLIIGLWLGLLLFKEKPAINKALILIIFACLLRPTWAFSILSFVPLLKTKKEKVIYSTIGVFTITGFIWLTGMFFEKTTLGLYGIIEAIKTLNFGLVTEIVYYNIINNFFRYFSFEPTLIYAFIKFMPLGLLLFFCVKAFKNKGKQEFSFILSTGIMFVYLFTNYEMDGGRDIRTLAPYVMLSIPLISLKYQKTIWAFSSIFILGFILSLAYFHPIQERNNYSFSELRKIEAKNQEKIGSIEPDENNFLIDYYPLDYTFDLLALPVKSINGNRLNYAIPWYPTKKIKCNYLVKRNNKHFTFTRTR